MVCVCIKWNISHKKYKLMSFAAMWMQLEIILLREANQKCHITYMWHIKWDTNEPIYEIGFHEVAESDTTD